MLIFSTYRSSNNPVMKEKIMKLNSIIYNWVIRIGLWLSLYLNKEVIMAESNDTWCFM